MPFLLEGDEDIGVGGEIDGSAVHFLAIALQNEGVVAVRHLQKFRLHLARTHAVAGVNAGVPVVEGDGGTVTLAGGVGGEAANEVRVVVNNLHLFVAGAADNQKMALGHRHPFLRCPAVGVGDIDFSRRHAPGCIAAD